jgi:hypothetical protein
LTMGVPSTSLDHRAMIRPAPRPYTGMPSRDRGCTRPNCLEPGYRCEVHHSPDWARGRRTDADKLFFACGRDHGGASRGEWRTEVR